MNVVVLSASPGKDREATCGGESGLADKPVIAVAAAGGNGTITCLLAMERWSQHLGARVFDLVPVKRWTREYKLATIRQAAHAMVQEAWGKAK